MIKVTHIISNLGGGGAETMLYRLICGMDTRRFENEVISLTDLGSNGGKIRGAGVPVRALGMKTGIPDPFPLVRLRQWIWHVEADDRSDLHVPRQPVGRAGRGRPDSRRAAYPPGESGPAIKQASHDLDRKELCADVSVKLPSCALFVSQASLALHTTLGYAAKRMEVIPNGFDLDEFSLIDRAVVAPSGTPHRGRRADHWNGCPLPARKGSP